MGVGRGLGCGVCYLAEREAGVVSKARAALGVRERLLEVVALVPERRELVFGEFVSEGWCGG